MSITNFEYNYSVGYFILIGNETNGIVLELPNGHNHEDRIKVAKESNIDWDYCILLYTDDHKSLFANNILDKDLALGVNKALTEIVIFNYSDKNIIHTEKIRWSK